MRHPSLFLMITLFHSCILLPTVTVAQTANPWPEPVVAYFKQTFPSTFTNLGDQGFNGLFDAVGDLTIFNIADEQGRIYLGSKREIFDNQDPRNTYTVVDKLTLNLAKSIPIFETPLGPGLPIVSLSIGGVAAAQFLNIRRSTTLEKLPPVDWEMPEAKNLLDNDPKLSSWNDINNRQNAQWAKFLKRVTIPGRIPFSSHGFKRLDAGEIIGFDLQGTISLGAAIGAGVSGLGKVIPDLGLGMQTAIYLKGHWRYTILKEDERFARLKVGRAKKGWGVNYGVGAHFEDKVIFEGFTLTNKIKNVFKTRTSITPFRLQVSHDHERMFDQCFRYDLSQEDGKRAYALAMRGNLQESEEIAENSAGKPNPAVEKIFTRVAKNNTTLKDRAVKLWFFYRQQDNRAVRNVDAVLTMPDGEHHLLRSISDNSHEWATTVGQFEKFRYQFSFFLNEDRYLKGEKDSLSLMAEGFIEDNVSSGVELRRYERQFETLAGVDHEVFPRLPVYPPVGADDECTGWKGWTDYSCIIRKITFRKMHAYYGRSTFYMRLGFDRPMLERFINTPKENMWPIIATAFNIPPEKWQNGATRTGYTLKHLYSYVVNPIIYFFNGHLKQGDNLDAARRFHRKWLNIQEEPEVTKKLHKLGKIFSTVFYGEEMVKILRLAQENHPIPYSLVGTNRMFTTQVREEKWGHTVTDYLSQLARKDMDFEDTKSTVVLDDQSRVNPFEVVLLEANRGTGSTGETDTPNIRMNLNFTLLQKPKYLYLKILTLNNRGMPRKVSEVMIANTIGIDSGKNTMTLGSLDTTGIGSELLSRLKLNHVYKILIAASQDGRIWGPAATQDIRTGPTLTSLSIPE